jgi:long-chain fatty acid transport protein
MLKRLTISVAIVFLVDGAICSRGAEGAGFFLAQQSVPGLGRAFAGGAAAASDASTIFTNPAGMTGLPGAELMVGGSLLMPSTKFDNRGSTASTPGTLGAPVATGGGSGGNPYTPTLVPSVYAALPLDGGRIWLGLGVSVPYGLATEYDDDWFGRYDTIQSELRTVDVAPTFAVRVADWLSLGAGVDIEYADAKLTQAIPDPFQPGGPTAASDGRNRVSGDDWAVGFNAGILVSPWDGTRVGLHYRSRINHELRGDNKISGLGGPLAAFNGRADARADLDLPDIVSLAVAQRLSAVWTVLAEAQWFNWSRFQELRVKVDGNDQDLVVPQDYQDSYTLAIGAEYEPAADWRLRAGLRYETTPTINRYRTTGLPDADNYTFALGGTYRIRDGLAIDLGLFQTFWEDSRVDVTRTFFAGTAAASSARVRGEASSTSTTVALGLRYNF